MREAQCIEKRKRDGTFLLHGSDIPISVSLTEVGGYWLVHDRGRTEQIKSGDLVSIHEDSGEGRLARFITGAKHFSAKVIYEGEMSESLVASRQIGSVEPTQ